MTTPTRLKRSSDRVNRMRSGPPGWKPLPPVKGAGRMTPDRGYEPENDEYFDLLTEVDENGRRVGRDPMDIPLDLLTASGHPALRTRSLKAAMKDVVLVDELKRHKDLRQQCLTCAENAAEVRHCAVIDCPFWLYRTGRNPHNPRRGVKPRFGR